MYLFDIRKMSNDLSKVNSNCEIILKLTFLVIWISVASLNDLE